MKIKLRLILYKSINEISPKNHTRTPLFEIKKLSLALYAEHKPSDDNGITVINDLVFARHATPRNTRELFQADQLKTISQISDQTMVSTEYTLASYLILYYKNNLII